MFFDCKSTVCQADDDEEMFELDSDESEGKDWDELEAEAAKGNNYMLNDMMQYIKCLSHIQFM